MSIPGIPDFRPHAKHERVRCALEQWSEANWEKVPEGIRLDVERHLKAAILAQAPELLDKWRDQHRRGIEIGSDDPRFHLGLGMAVRNTCRECLTDDKLPAVTVDHKGEPYMRSGIPGNDGARNWDDYYFGVLAAIAA